MTQPAPSVTATDEALYVKRLSPRTVIIVAAVFNAILGFALLLAGLIVISAAANRGLIDRVNSVTADLGHGGDQHISAGQLCLVWAAIVTAWALVMTLLAGLATVILNCVLQLLGGIQLDVSGARSRPKERARRVRRLATAVAEWVAAARSASEPAVNRSEQAASPPPPSAT
jgi:hypothetical protein